jgi:hypothetical protein
MPEIFGKEEEKRRRKIIGTMADNDLFPEILS